MKFFVSLSLSPTPFSLLDDDDNDRFLVFAPPLSFALSTPMAACISRGVSTTGRVAALQQQRQQPTVSVAPLAPAAMLRSTAAASTSSAAAAGSLRRFSAARLGVSSRVWQFSFCSSVLAPLASSLSRARREERDAGEISRRERGRLFPVAVESSQPAEKLSFLFSLSTPCIAHEAPFQSTQNFTGCLSRCVCRDIVAPGGIRKVRIRERKPFFFLSTYGDEKNENGHISWLFI